MQDPTPTVDHATGEIIFSGMPTWMCGGCGQMPMICTCASSGHPGKNLVIKSLPPPPPTSTPDQLLRRWVSILRLSPCARFDAKLWALDNANATLRAMRERKDKVLRLVAAYMEGLPNEAIYPMMVKRLSPLWFSIRTTGWTEDAKLEIIRRMLDSSTAAFLAGDWACVTGAGIFLLLEAFPVREEFAGHELLRDDAMMETIFDSAMVLFEVMSESYNLLMLAVEDSNDGMCPPRWHGWYRYMVESGGMRVPGPVG